MKLLTLEDLTKAAGGLGGHFAAASAMHKAVAAHHEALHKHHSEMAAFTKGKHDAMDDGHEMKSYMGKASDHHMSKAAHHDDLHKLHKAHAEACDDMSKTFAAADKAVASAPVSGAPAPAPAAGSPAPAPAEGLKGMLDQTTTALVGKALESLNSDPTVAQAIQKMVLEQVQAALGNKLVPSDVRAVLPDIPAGGSATGRDTGVQLVPRSGSAPVVDTSTVPPEFRHLVEA